MNVYKSILSARTSADEEIENVSGGGLFNKNSETKGSNPATVSVRRPVQRRMRAIFSVTAGLCIAISISVYGSPSVCGDGICDTTEVGFCISDCGTSGNEITIVGTGNTAETFPYPPLPFLKATEDVVNIENALRDPSIDVINLVGDFYFGQWMPVIRRGVTIRGEEPSLTYNTDPTKPHAVVGGTWPTTISATDEAFGVWALDETTMSSGQPEYTDGLDHSNETIIIENLDINHDLANPTPGANGAGTLAIWHVGKYVNPFTADADLSNPAYWAPEYWKEGGNLTVRKSQIGGGPFTQGIMSSLVDGALIVENSHFLYGHTKNGINTGFGSSHSLISVTNTTLEAAVGAEPTLYGFSMINWFDEGPDHTTDGKLIFKDNILNSTAGLLGMNIGGEIEIENNYLRRGVWLNSFNKNGGTIKDNIMEGMMMLGYTNPRWSLTHGGTANGVHGMTIANNIVKGEGFAPIWMMNTPENALTWYWAFTHPVIPNTSSNNVITGNDFTGFKATVSQIVLDSGTSNNIIEKNKFGSLQHNYADVFTEEYATWEEEPLAQDGCWKLSPLHGGYFGTNGDLMEFMRTVIGAPTNYVGYLYCNVYGVCDTPPLPQGETTGCRFNSPPPATYKESVKQTPLAVVSVAGDRNTIGGLDHKKKGDFRNDYTGSMLYEAVKDGGALLGSLPGWTWLEDNPQAGVDPESGPGAIALGSGTDWTGVEFDASENIVWEASPQSIGNWPSGTDICTPQVVDRGALDNTIIKWNRWCANSIGPISGKYQNAGGMSKYKDGLPGSEIDVEMPEFDLPTIDP